jgi:hypothetical protein
MVKIAIAGGSGRMYTHNAETLKLISYTELAREVVDSLVATRKHEITLLARSVSNKLKTQYFISFNVTERFLKVMAHPVSLGLPWITRTKMGSSKF